MRLCSCCICVETCWDLNPGYTEVFNRWHKWDIGISDVNDILGTTKDTPPETMSLMLDLPPMQIKQKVEQIKAYFSILHQSEWNLHNDLQWSQSSCWNKRRASKRTSSAPVSGLFAVGLQLKVGLPNGCPENWKLFVSRFGLAVRR